MSYCNNCGTNGIRYAGCGGGSYISNLENAVNNYFGNVASYSMSEVNYLKSNPGNTLSSIIYEKNIHNKIDFKKDDYKIESGKTISYFSNIDDFLNPERQVNFFADDFNEIREFVEDAFFMTTETIFPEDIRINLVDARTMEERYGSGVQGFVINRKTQGKISDIFVKKDLLDRVMLTIGHEIGHVLTLQLPNPKDEEAKAFAFAMKWMKTIKENNIANLANSIVIEKPAKNGVHDVALEFVINKLNSGEDISSIHKNIVAGEIRVEEYGA